MRHRFKNIHKPLIILFLAFGFSASLNAGVSAYFNCGAFNTPQNRPFLETYLTIVGKSLFAKETNGHYQCSVNIVCTIFKDSAIVKANKYNLLGPEFNDKEGEISFIDNQRYSLPNGIYTIELSLTDNYSPGSKPFVIKETVQLAFSTKELQSSSIQLLESFKKAAVPGPISKSGYDLVPYTVNYYPESVKDLSFYFEAYNTDTILGSGKPFIYYYYLETSNNFVKLESYGSFKKQKASKINPLLDKIDIGKLSTGNYNLVIEIKDANNITHLQKKIFFRYGIP